MSWVAGVTGGDKLTFEERTQGENKLELSFHRSLVTSETELRTPSGLGKAPLYDVSKLQLKEKPEWTKDSTLLPLHENESVFLALTGHPKLLKAVKILVNGKNIVTGEEDKTTNLHDSPVDFIIPQITRYVDSINLSERDKKRRYVAPLKNSSATSTEIVFQIFDLKEKPVLLPEPVRMCSMQDPRHTRFAGPILPRKQQVLFLTDTPAHVKQPPLNAWNDSPSFKYTIHLVNTTVFEKVTGHKAPETPVCDETYQIFNFPQLI